MDVKVSPNCASCALGYPRAVNLRQIGADMKTVENYLTVLQVLDIHADYGQLDRALVKQAMGPNWPKEWDLIPDDGSGIFEASRPLKKSSQTRFRTSGI